MKESAIDCALTYQRNIVNDPKMNGTRECDYQKCNYDCDGIPNDFYKQNKDITRDLKLNELLGL